MSSHQRRYHRRFLATIQSMHLTKPIHTIHGDIKKIVVPRARHMSVNFAPPSACQSHRRLDDSTTSPVCRGACPRRACAVSPCASQGSPWTAAPSALLRPHARIQRHLQAHRALSRPVHRRQLIPALQAKVDRHQCASTRGAPSTSR